MEKKRKKVGQGGRRRKIVTHDLNFGRWEQVQEFKVITTT